MATMVLEGYVAQIEFDEEEDAFRGRVSNIRDVVTFQGRSPAELRRELAKSLKVYASVCREEGRDPDRPFSGKFVVRVEPDLHRAIAQAAEASGQSLNGWATQALGAAAGSGPSKRTREPVSVRRART